METAEIKWDLRLYVYDGQARSQAAIKNLKRVCHNYLPEMYNFEIIDIEAHPEIAREQQIVAVPTLQKLNPEPKILHVGDFSVVANVLKGLGIEESEKSGKGK